MIFDAFPRTLLLDVVDPPDVVVEALHLPSPEPPPGEEEGDGEGDEE